MSRAVLTGNEAIARGAWEAGVAFGSGYPGTPSSEILPALAELGDAYTEWSVNEKCALEAAAGASLAGARCLVTMKHVGVNVAADPLFTLSYTGIGGGLVLVSADDPAMHSSQNEQDNRHYARAAKVPMLEPSDSQEAKDFTACALAISEQFDVPVILRTTTRIAHSAGVVQLAERQRPAIDCAMEPNPQKYVMVPAHARKRHAIVAERTRKLIQFAEETDLTRVEAGSSDIGIIASGVAYQYAKEACPEASFLKLGLTWPLPPERLRAFAESVAKVYVVEEGDPVLAEQVRALGVRVEPVPESLELGELSPERVAAALKGEDVTPPESDLAPRPPVMCPGCSHRGVFMALRKLKAYVAGDIGCYTLGALPPLGALHTCLCMGAGIGQAHGVDAVCEERSNVVAVIGDSTFIHSGITGLINIAYNGGAAAVVILDNSTTAMTGGQDHPGTGRTLSKRPGRQLDLVGVCKAAGIPSVEVINPRDLEATEAALRRAMGSPEPAVVIARCPCVNVYRERQAPRAIDEQACVQCGVCLRTGCPAITTRPTDDPKKPQPMIDASLCVGCSLCVQVCPKDAIRLLSELSGD